MIKITLLYCLAFLSLLPHSLWAQKQYNEQENFLMANRVWVFGRKAGLDFSSGKPVSIKTVDSLSLEGTASACDPLTGALLFHVVQGGRKAYNRNHQIMPNGDSLGGSAEWSTNQTCIVPAIDSPGIYYVFSLAEYSSPSLPYHRDGLRYSIIDMSLDNGLGAVRPGKKGILLDSNRLSESVIAIPGNNCDIWLLTHVYDKPEFRAFHITQNGIDSSYVASAPPGPNTNRFVYSIGHMASSPNRERLCIKSDIGTGSTTQIILYKFNPGTGQVYDPLVLKNPTRSSNKLVMGGATFAFSPDNSKLYMTLIDSFIQYDISIYDPIAIDTSRYILSRSTLNNYNYGLRLYGDTLYIGSNGNHLSTISHPNMKGAACGYDSASIMLLPSTSSQYFGCAEIVYPFAGNSTHGLALDTLLCSDGFNLDLTATPGYNYYYWQDGYMGAQRQINTPGTYWVNGTVLRGEGGQGQDCSNRIDTFIIRGDDFIPPVITVNVFELSTTLPYDTYQWYFNGTLIPGATNRKLQVNKNGNYTVDVSNKSGCKGISAIYTVTNATGIDALTQATMMEVYPNPVQDMLYVHSTELSQLCLYSIEGRIVRKATNANSISLEGLATGVYILHLCDRKGNSLKKVKITKCD